MRTGPGNAAGRRPRGGRVAAAAGLACALLAGCATGTGGAGDGTSGDGTDPTAVAPTPTPSGPITLEPMPTPSALPATLTVAVDATGAGTPTSWTLTCEPAGGTHPDPDAACLALGTAEGRAALDPVPRDVACTEIWGGPQTATITGELDGEAVDAQLSRSNGCEIARWDALVPVLGTAGGA